MVRVRCLQRVGCSCIHAHSLQRTERLLLNPQVLVFQLLAHVFMEVRLDEKVVHVAAPRNGMYKSERLASDVLFLLLGDLSR